MERNLIIGMGQIGKAINGIFRDAQTRGIEMVDIEQPIDIMHICYPYSKDFVAQVHAHKGLYNPKHVIIYSTVPIGTTKKIPGAVHSPVEGRHPDLELSIRTMPRWIGTNDDNEYLYFANLFSYRFIKTRQAKSSDFTEFLKIRSTAKYGINLVWTDYEKTVADKLDMDFELLKEFDKDYNKLYHELGEDWAQRYILDPPEGKIGGHCVVPNAKLLNEQYPHKWLEELSKW